MRSTPHLSEGSASVDVLNHVLKQGSATCDGFKPGADPMFYSVGLYNRTSIPRNFVWLLQPDKVREGDLGG